jgi:hypothetical protein
MEQVPMRDKVRCYAHGTKGDWQGHCIDFDIAVQGTSLNEILELLGEAVSTYVDDLAAEDRETARRLLARRAPWHVRAKLALSSALHILRVGHDDHRLTANFDVPCHA